MPNENTTSIPSLGEYRRRQQAAKDRAEARIAPPDVGAIRAGILERREAAMEADIKEANQKAPRPGEVYRKTLDLVSDDVLYEMQRSLPNLSTRHMADIIGDVLTGRRQARQAADFTVAAQDAPTTARKPVKAA